MSASVIPLLPGIRKVARDEWAAPCPRCGGRDRLRAWDPENGKGRFWCRRCEWKGDAIDLLMEQGMGYREACAAVGKAVVTAPKTLPSARLPTKRAAAQFDRAAATAFALAHAGPSDYSRHRGLQDELCSALKIGWHPVGRQVPGLGFVPAGLVMPRWHGKEVAAIKVRCVPDWRERRFFQLGDPSPWALALELAKPVVIVESEIDGLLLAQECRDLVGVISLRSAVSKPGPELLARIKAAPVVLVALDWDEAGRAAWPWWRKNLPNAKRHVVACGKDISDMHAAGVDLKTWITLGLSSLD